MDVLNIKLTKKTKSKEKFSVDKHVFAKIQKKHPVLKQIAQYNLRDTLYGTFIVGILGKVLDGRLYGNYNFHVVRSGRLSSSGPNHQNFPNTPEFNHMIKARDGYTLVYWDLSNIEARLAAILSGDPALIATFCKPGGDLHASTAKVVFNLPETVDEISKIAKADKDGEYARMRQICKVVNFLAIYGGTWKALMKSLDFLSEKEAKKYIQNFWAGYQGLRDWFAALRKQIAAEKKVTCINGRTRWFNKAVLINQYLTAKELNSMCNTTIQGPASDIELEMAKKVYDKATEQGLDAVPVRVVHDSCMFEVKDEDVDQFVTTLRPLAHTWPEWIGDTRGVLLESEIQVGKAMDQLHLVAA